MKNVLHFRHTPTKLVAILAVILVASSYTKLRAQNNTPTDKSKIVVTTLDDEESKKIGWQIVLKLDKNEQGAWVDLNNNGKQDAEDIALIPNKRTGTCGVFEKITSTTITIYANALGIEAPVNNLTAVDLTACPSLEFVTLNDNLYSKLDVSPLKNLKVLVCFGNKALTALDVTKNTNLVALQCGQTSITSLDVTQNKLLEELDITEANLKSINLSNNPKLKKFIATRAKLESLELINKPDLYMVDIVGCKGLKTPLDMNSNPKLQYYYFAAIGWDNVGKIDNCQELRYIAPYLNNITEPNANLFANNLPEHIYDGGGIVWAVDTKDIDGEVEHNYFNTAAVKRMRDKGYKVVDFKGYANEGQGVDYDGLPITNDAELFGTQQQFICAPTVANSTITLQVPQQLLGETATIFTLGGEAIKQITLNANHITVDISTLCPNGYIIDANGKATASFTIIRR